jgi:hypothetical protein
MSKSLFQHMRYGLFVRYANHQSKQKFTLHEDQNAFFELGKKTIVIKLSVCLNVF